MIIVIGFFRRSIITFLTIIVEARNAFHADLRMHTAVWSQEENANSEVSASSGKACSAPPTICNAPPRRKQAIARS